MSFSCVQWFCFFKVKVKLFSPQSLIDLFAKLLKFIQESREMFSCHFYHFGLVIGDRADFSRGQRLIVSTKYSR